MASIRIILPVRMVAAVMAAVVCTAAQADAPAETHWVTVWAASAHGPFPSGNNALQPDPRFAFPDGQARDQTFRLMLRPDLWGRTARLRFSNRFGTAPVTIDGVYLGLQMGSAALLAGSNHPVRFAGGSSAILAPGQSLWSDPVQLGEAADQTGRNAAVSFHIAGVSGPMTWHAKAMTTSFVSPPGSGAVGGSEDEAAFPFTIASWFFLDAVDMALPARSRTIVAFGDSITDGSGSTLNGEDRWPNVLARRLHRRFGDRFALVNEGIGGNQVAGPPHYDALHPVPGGPSALDRLDNDVLSLSSVAAVIWLEGINDLAAGNDRPVEEVTAAMSQAVARMRKSNSRLKILGATLTPALGSTSRNHGSAAENEKRRKLNEFIAGSGLFDGVLDFSAATEDPPSGEMRPDFVPDSSNGGPGDKLHPNHAGYLVIGQSIDLGWFEDLARSPQ